MIESREVSVDPMLVHVPENQSRNVRRDHVESLKALMLKSNGFDTAEGLIRVIRQAGEPTQEAYVVVDGMHRLTAVKELIAENRLPVSQTIPMSVLTGESGRTLSSLEVLALASSYNQSGHNVAKLNHADRLYMAMSVLRTMSPDGKEGNALEEFTKTLMDLNVLSSVSSVRLKQETVTRYARVVLSMTGKPTSWQKLLTVVQANEKAVAIELLVSKGFLNASELEQRLFIDAFLAVRQSMDAGTSSRRGSGVLRNGRETALVSFIGELLGKWRSRASITEADADDCPSRTLLLEAVAKWPSDISPKTPEYGVRTQVIVVAFDNKLKTLDAAPHVEADIASGSAVAGPTAKPDAPVKGGAFPAQSTESDALAAMSRSAGEESDDGDESISQGEDVVHSMSPAGSLFPSSSVMTPGGSDVLAATPVLGKRSREDDEVVALSSSQGSAPAKESGASTLAPLRRSLRSAHSIASATPEPMNAGLRSDTRSPKKRRIGKRQPHTRRGTVARGDASDGGSSGSSGDEQAEDPAFDDTVENPLPVTLKDPGVVAKLPAAVEKTRAKYYLTGEECAKVYDELSAMDFQERSLELLLNGYCTMKGVTTRDGATGSAVHGLLAAFSERFGSLDDPWINIINTNDARTDGMLIKRRVGRMTVSRKAITDDIEPRGLDGDETLYKKKLLVEVALGYVLERVKRQNSSRVQFPATGLRLLMTVAPRAGDCPRQTPHVDFELDDEASRDWTPRPDPSYFMMMTGAHGMTLHVWPFSHVLGNGPARRVEKLSAEVPNKLVHIPPYSIFVGRGDLVHAGAADTDLNPDSRELAYKHNTRVHLYAVREGYHLLDAIGLPTEFRFRYHD